MAQAVQLCDDQAYECPFCSEDFVDPVTLSCDHNLCLKCAKMLVYRGSLARKEAASADSGASSSKCESASGTFGFDCPLCRQRTVVDEKKGVEGLPPNIYLRNVVESKKQAALSIPQCSVCNQAQAKWTCLDCRNASFCEKCIEQHNASVNAMPWLQGQHNVVAARPQGKARAVKTCTEHKDEPLKGFCIQDGCLVCRDCITFGSHKGHESVLLKDAVAIWQAKIQEAMAEANEKWTALDQDYASGSVQEFTQNYDDGVKQVTQAFDELVEDIQAEKSAVLAKMESSYEATRRYMESADGVYKINKAAFEKLKQDVGSNDTALAAQADDDAVTHAAYLDAIRLHKKLQALMKDVDELPQTDLDTGCGGMWCDAQKWTDSLSNMATELLALSEKYCTTHTRPEMKISSLIPPVFPVRASKFLLTASEDKTARLWNSSTYAHVATLTGHTAGIKCAMYSPNRDFIVTASCDMTARIWNSETHQCVATLMGHTAVVWSARYSPDAKFIVTASQDNTSRIWNSSTYECVATLFGHTVAVYSAMYSPNAKFIVTASADRTARIWNSSTYECVATLQGHTDGVYSASYSPDGNSIITASSDRKARIWNSASYQLVATLKGHTDQVCSAMYSPNGRYIVTASVDNTARIWNSSTYACVATLKGHTGYIWSAMFSPDGKFIYTASGDNTARIWNCSAYECVATLQGHAAVRTLCI